MLNGRIHPQPGFEIKTFQIFYCPQNFTLYLFFFIHVVYGIVRTVPPCSTHNNSAHSTPRLTDLIFLYGFCFVYAHLNAVGMNKKQHDKKEKVLKIMSNMGSSDMSSVYRFQVCIIFSKEHINRIPDLPEKCKRESAKIKKRISIIRLLLKAKITSKSKECFLFQIFVMQTTTTY